MPNNSGEKATDKRIKNLKPLNTRTKEERKEIAKMGAEATNKAKKEKKLLKETLLLLLENDDAQGKICNAMINQAKRGNTKAFEVIRDTIGEKPVDKTETEMKGEIIVNFNIPRPKKKKVDKA